MEANNRIGCEDQIRIHNLEVFCNHGVYREENVLGQKFLVDAVLYGSTRKAGLSDELKDSVNYGEICRFISEEMKKQNDKLLEKVAERLAEGILLHFSKVRQVRVEVKKPWAPVMMHLDYASVTVNRGWHQVYIGLGSNMGDRMAYLTEAIEALRRLPLGREVKAAPIIETEPYGYIDQENFLNTVVSMEVLYEPYELLHLLHQIEKEANRERKIHWGPRTLDLDILLYDHQVTEKKDLVIPHPELEKRLFVLEPLCELNPYGVHPVLGKRYQDLKEDLRKTQNNTALADDNRGTR